MLGSSVLTRCNTVYRLRLQDSMETLHCQPPDSIARTQSQVPLFLHIFQKAEQVNHSGQASQVQSLPEELSATGIREASYSYDTIDSTRRRRKDQRRHSDTLEPISASEADSHTDRIYFHRKSPSDPSLDAAFDGEIKLCSSTNDVLNLFTATTGTSYALDEPGYILGQTRDGQVVPTEGLLENHLNAAPVLEARQVTRSVNYGALSMLTHDFNLDLSQLEAHDHASATHVMDDDYAGVMSGDDLGVAGDDRGVVSFATVCDDRVHLQDTNHVTSSMHTVEAADDNVLLEVDVADVKISRTANAQGVPSASAHDSTASVAEHPALSQCSRKETNHGLSSEDSKPSTFRQSWLRHFRGVSDSWHQSQDEASYSCYTPFDLDSDHSVVISAVLNIAKCLAKNETLQEHLQPFSGCINQHCGNAILYKLQKEQLFLQALSFFDWMRLHTPCLLTSRSLCTMFTILGEADMVDRAIVLYHNLRVSKELWVVQVFNALLSALCKHCRYEEALAIFKEMSDMKIRPDSVTFCILLNLGNKSGSSAKALWQVFLNMEKQKVFAGHEVFGILMKAFCREGLIDKAVKLLFVMEGRGLMPNIVNYNTLIGAFAKCGMLEEAEGLVSEMKEKKIQMTLVTYNILIDAYANSRNFEVAEGLLQKMLDKGPQPNVQCFTALIAAYGRNFQSEKAGSVFLRMKKNGVSPNVVTYTALIHAYAENGWHEKAEYAFEDMLREGFVPTVETYTSLLHAFRQAGDLEKVKCIWQRMRSERVIGTRATFNIIMDACAKQGEYAEARNVINDFKYLGCKPDRKTYNMLINAYTRGGQHSKASDLLEEMKNAGFFPDSYTYTSLIYCFLRVRDFTQAFKYHDRMCRENQLPDSYTYSKLRTLLDEKSEMKAVRNMKAAVGAQRAEYVGDKRKKPKHFRKHRRIFEQPNTF